ncbi:cupin domain-containing protein [Pseudonocardia sp. C8]|uniref:cupin domain-containing protein n=1 Tax=Pseudonocardia sp. C8 TaxID=2762759 RepID=UPI0016423836|nr:cupin domain-containing protein [Pseudonocardia sp. C8]MBC3193401.1 cupin domain-containing protein [Pseudonocardia sp. C8]
MQEIFGQPSGNASRERTVVVRGDAGDWEESEVAGFRTRTLFQDPVAGETTTLMQMDPGASAAVHSHEQIEQIYVIEGSFSDDAGTYRAGDYLVRPPGADHATWSEEGGLVLLVYTDPRTGGAGSAARAQ